MPHLPLLKPLDGVLSRGGSDYFFHAIRQKFDTILSCQPASQPASGRPRPVKVLEVRKKVKLVLSVYFESTVKLNGKR